MYESKLRAKEARRASRSENSVWQPQMWAFFYSPLKTTVQLEATWVSIDDFGWRSERHLYEVMDSFVHIDMRWHESCTAYLCHRR